MWVRLRWLTQTEKPLNKSNNYSWYNSIVTFIQFNNVSKRFMPADDGLEDVTFSVEPGEFIFVTGPSGAGKTTLLRLLTREYTPTRGEILFQDQNIVQLSKKLLPEHRRKIGVVYQDYRLVPELNVWENVSLPLQINRVHTTTIEQRVTDLLTLVGMTHKALLFPRQLSGGEAQRISIARALALAPTVVFADEPTGNLDSETTKSIVELLHKINSLGTTLFLATHDEVVLKMFPKQRQIKLKNGTIEVDSNQEVTKKTAPKTEKTHSKATEETADTKNSEEEPESPEEELDSAETKSKKQSGNFLKRLLKKS